MSDRNNGLAVFLMGGIIGAVLGMLYAPRAGEQTRRILVETSQDMKDKALNSVQEARATAMSALEDAESRLGTLSEQSKVRLDRLQKIGKSTLNEQKQSLKAGIEQAKRSIAEPTDTGDTSTDRTSTY